MTKINRIFRLMIGVMLVTVILACNFSQTTPEPEPPTPVPPTSTPPPSPEPTPEAPPAIEHKDIPVDLPYQRTSQAGDQDSSTTANQKRAPGGDRFTFGRYERPFSANTMEQYFPELDIINSIFYEDDDWIYAAITLRAGDKENLLSGTYGFEIDSDLDGSGEWLILASNPSSTDWSVKGVQVWYDSNGDVGGRVTVGADEYGNGNGYETLLFDSGQGDDPDLAWVRIAPQDPTTVQMAVKTLLLKGDKSYMAGAWAGRDLNPALFDFNDHMTHEQAGAALIELENFYPIKELAELDSVCRVAVGFQPQGNEPGLCVTNPPKKVACPSGQYQCYNFGNQQICVCVP